MYTRYLNISFHLCALALKMCATRNRATIKNGVDKTTLGNVPLVLEARDKRNRGRGEGRGGKRDLIGENRGW